MSPVLTIRAGTEARRIIERDGFDPDMFGLLLGASGGPKWLVLSHIDRVLASRLIAPRTKRLRMMGSSIGAWRHSCMARRDPLAAIELFEELYIGQSYDGRPGAERVSADTAELTRKLLGADGIEELLSADKLDSYIVTVRSRGPMATENHVGLQLGLAVAALANAVSRRTLPAFFERVVFGPEPSGISFASLRTFHRRLTPANFERVLLASGSLPLAMRGVDGIEGAERGLYRDGGLTDYNFDFEFDHGDGLLLFPHFFDRISPGWFDKGLRWRRPVRERLSRTLMICPSAEFIAGLPGGRVPDRSDFVRYSTTERWRIWREVAGRCQQLAEELEELIDRGRLGAVLEDFLV